MMKIYEKNLYLMQEESSVVLDDCIVLSADLLKQRNGKLCIQFENISLFFLPLSSVEERLSANRRKTILT